MSLWSTIWSDDESYNHRVTVLDYRVLGWKGLIRALGRLGHHDVVIVNGALGYSGRWRDLVCVALTRARGRRIGLVVSDATWHPRSSRGESRSGPAFPVYAAIERGLVRSVLSDRTIVCFLSRHEVERFLVETATPATNATFTPFTVTVPSELSQQQDRSDGTAETPYVFSGGDTLRDWELISDALGDVAAPVRVATRHQDRPWPANFVVGPMANAEFFRTAASAAVGVVALRSDVHRSAGQQTYLNLLVMGVPVVVNDAPGVRDHLEGVPGAFITGADDAAAMGERVTWLLDAANADAIRGLVATGREIVLDRYGPAAYLGRLVDIAAALEERLAVTPSVDP